jgi:hypothetical protein
MSEPEQHPHGPTRAAPASDIQILAAVTRAERHRAGGVCGASGAPAPAGVPDWTILAHLDLARRSAAARAARARLQALLADGALSRSRRYGRELWRATEAGTERLEHARREWGQPPLPEAPQHREWRLARTAAAREIERFRAALGEDLQDAQRLLARDPAPHSDEWLVLAERLRARARRLGSASHCLHEWPEPDDAHADVDERREAGDAALPEHRREALRALRAGRRNVRLWGGERAL